MIFCANFVAVGHPIDWNALRKDPPMAAALFKLFLRDLPNPLLTPNPQVYPMLAFYLFGFFDDLDIFSVFGCAASRAYGLFSELQNADSFTPKSEPRSFAKSIWLLI